MQEQIQQAFFANTPLLAIRMGALLRLVPFFGGRPLPLLPWAILSLGLAILSTPLQSAHPNVVFLGGAWLALGFKELFLGVVMGALVRIAFSVLQISGELARISTLMFPNAPGEDLQRGAPLNNFFLIIGTAVFFLVGGHHAFFAGIIGSVRCFPPGVMLGSQTPALPGASTTIDLFATSMATAVMICAPLFFAGLVVDFATGLMVRLVPGIGVNIGAQTMRSVVVQIALLAMLGALISVAVGFLVQSMGELSLCSA